MSDINVADIGAATAEPVQPAAAETPAPEQTGQTDQQQEAKQETSEERKFSQAELEAAVQRRLAKERRRFERELRSMVDQRQPQQQAAPADDEPKREAFQDYEQYLDARAEFRARKAANEHVQRFMSEREQATAAADLSMAAQDVIEHGRREFKDFDAQINAAFESGVIEPGGALHRALVQSDDGHKLAYHLATNPQDAARMAQMPAARQLIELGRLSARLEKQASAAPPPPKPVTATASPVEKDWWARSPAEILKERAKERVRR
jgi:hypothetical protein